MPVLIVEDEIPLANELRNYHEKEGFSCDKAPTGKIASDKLFSNEYDILSFMILNKNRVVTRLQISEQIWGDIIEENYNLNYIDVHIKNLRKKLGEFIEGDFLETVRGIRFQFAGI